jgi:H+/gluconate symporter-like permease
VPPTPGPIAAAGIIGANLGLVILFGLAASLFALFFAWLFSIKVAAKVPIDPNPELTEEAIALKNEGFSVHNNDNNSNLVTDHPYCTKVSFRFFLPILWVKEFLNHSLVL